MKKTIETLLLCSLILILPKSAYATLWKLDFRGELSNITEYLGEISTATRGNYNFHESRFNIGQSFSGNFIIDDTAVAGTTLATDSERDIYRAVINSYLDIDGYIYQKGNTFPSYAHVWNRDSTNTIRDVFSAEGNTYDRPFDMGVGRDLSSFEASLFDRDGDLFSSTNLVQTLTELSSISNIVQEFEYARLSFLHVSTGDNVINQYLSMEGDFLSFNVSQVISHPVPEPSTLAIFALGMIGLTSRRLKK